MKLKKIITEHPDVLNNVAMFKGILLDTYNQPENKGKINLLLNAYEIYIIDEIAQNDLDDVFVERMKKKLISTYSVTDNSAEWAIKTWCSEYGNGILGKEICFSAFTVDDVVEEITTQNTVLVIENSKQLVLKDGTLYEGEVFADIPHGCGKAEYKNGDVYKGYWNRGLRSGQGVLIYENGTEWTGEFKDDKFWDGKGYTYSNDAVYEGEWKNGKKHGSGKLVWNDGGEWIGEFKDGKRWNGSGIDRYKGGTYYDGPLIEGKSEGFGKYYYNDAVYEGEWKNGIRHGQGKLIWHQGGEWVGEFKDDKRWNGNGTVKYDTGMYEGELLNGERKGIGKFSWNNGDIYEGQWKNDKKDGKGKYIHSDSIRYPGGAIYDGHWKNDERDGQGELIWSVEENIKWQGVFNQGKPWEGEGVWLFRTYHKDEKSGEDIIDINEIYSGTIKSGKRIGHGTCDYCDATYEGNWENDKKNGQGVIEWSQGGNWVGEFKDDSPWIGRGIWRFSDLDYYEGAVTNGQMNGKGVLVQYNCKYTGWFVNGNFQNGTKYNANTNIQTRYSNGQEVQGGCYIATCVYGSYDCPQVWTLRRYRDKKLANTWYGRIFIKIYYAISPTLVKLFGNTNWFKCYWKNKLDKIVLKLQSDGFDNTFYEDEI